MSFELEATLRNNRPIDEYLDEPDADPDELAGRHGDVAALPGGRLVTSCGDTRDRAYTLKVFDSKQGCVNTTVAHERYVRCLAVFRDGRVVSAASTYGNSSIKVWDYSDDGRCLLVLPEPPRYLTCVEILMDRFVVAGGYSYQTWQGPTPIGVIKKWDPSDGRLLQTLTTNFYNEVNCIAAREDGLVIAGCADGALSTWDLREGICLQRMACLIEGHQRAVSCVVVLPDQCRVVAGHEAASGVYPGGAITIWDFDANSRRHGHGHGRCLRILFDANSRHKFGISCVASVGGSRVITGSSDKDLKLWDVDTGRCLQTLDGVTFEMELPDGVEPKEGPGHEDSVWSVAVLPDGRIASASRDGTIKIWVDRQREDESHLAAQVGRQRACADVVAVIKKFL